MVLYDSTNYRYVRVASLDKFPLFLVIFPRWGVSIVIQDEYWNDEKNE